LTTNRTQKCGRTAFSNSPSQEANRDKRAGQESAIQASTDNKLTRRNNGRNNVTFADGPVQTVQPEFVQQIDYYDPLY